MAVTFIRSTAARQLADTMREEIKRGQWSHGARLPSMRVLAERYGVSLTTVQKAIEELDRHKVIERGPRRCGIVQSGAASKSAPGRKHIGAVFGLDPNSSVSPWFIQRIVHSAQMELSRNGYVVTLFNYWQDKPEHARQAIESLRNSLDSLAGIYVFAMDGIFDLTRFLDDADVPWVSINPLALGTDYNFVMGDQLAAGRLVGRCFARLGYQRVVVVHDSVDNVSPLEKVTGLYQGYVLEGVPAGGIELLRVADMEIATGYHGMRRHLQSGPPPQAIFSTADTLAIGAMQACQEQGLRVPEDVGVVGSSGVPVSELRSDPPLTELRQPVETMGQQVALSLLEMIRRGVRRVGGKRIAIPLVLRASLNVPDDLRKELGIESSAEDDVPSMTPVDAGAKALSRSPSLSPF